MGAVTHAEAWTALRCDRRYPFSLRLKLGTMDGCSMGAVTHAEAWTALQCDRRDRSDFVLRTRQSRAPVAWEPLPMLKHGRLSNKKNAPDQGSVPDQHINYSMTLATTPEPTVRPPSRIAKRSPCSMAMGVIRVISMSMLSPGITISTPSGSLMLPVTSVVRK